MSKRRIEHIEEDDIIMNSIRNGEDELTEVFQRISLNDHYDIVVVPKVKRMKNVNNDPILETQNKLFNKQFIEQFIAMMFNYNELQMSIQYNKIINKLDNMHNKIKNASKKIAILEEHEKDKMDAIHCSYII